MGLGQEPEAILFYVQFGLGVILSGLFLFPFPRSSYLAVGEKENESPELTANFFSVLSFWWITPLMVLGFKKPLTQEDLWALNPKDEAGYVSEQFEEAWDEELKKPKYHHYLPRHSFPSFDEAHAL